MLGLGQRQQLVLGTAQRTIPSVRDRTDNPNVMDRTETTPSVRDRTQATTSVRDRTGNS